MRQQALVASQPVRSAGLPAPERGLSDRQACRWFAVFVAGHLLVWTLLPTLVNPNLPLDVIEALAWGGQWQWGYEKHPPLSAWAAKAAAMLGGGHDAAMYLLSQLCVALAMWGTWRLARELMDAARALAAGLLMGGVYYHQFTSPEFNVNVLQLPLWSLGLWCFWRAAHHRHGGYGWWLGVGACMGLALLTKYLAVFLAVPMLLYCLLTASGRRQWTRSGPYLAVLVSLGLFAPHVWWMLENDFLTVRYGLDRADPGGGAWWDHLVYPLRFVFSQALAGLLAIVVAALAFAGLPRAEAMETQRRRWIWIAALGPVLAMAALSLVTGMRLRSMWGTPMLVALPLLLVYAVDVQALVRSGRWRRAVTIGVIAAALPVLAYAAQSLALPYLRGEASRVHFPGEALAREVETRWRAQFADAPLRVVIGDEWSAGNIGWYAPARPRVYLHGDPRLGPSMDAMVRVHGAAVVWPIAAGDEPAMLDALRERFPSLRVAGEPVVLPAQTPADVPPASIGLAWIPPAGEDD